MRLKGLGYKMANTNVVPKKCENCPIITKGIWIRKGKMLCYDCYVKATTRMPQCKPIL